MTKDVVPEILEKIQEEYEDQIGKSKYITSFLKRLANETAKDAEVSLYGNELGECASKAFLKCVRPEHLPDGILYWNIAERIVKDLLKDVYDRVNSAADTVQRINDKRDGINIKPQHASFPEGRIRDLTDKIIEVYEKGVQE